MRVIGGVARGRILKSPPAGVRPTSDRVREALFSALEAQGVEFDSVLDAFAGSGALGIEALSRGDGMCDFVEGNPKAAAVIQENLNRAGLSERAHVHRFRVEEAPERLRGPYTLVLADPPYEDPAAIIAVEQLGTLLSPTGTLVLEQSSRNDARERLGGLQLDWSRRYGDTLVSMYRRAS